MCSVHQCVGSKHRYCVSYVQIKAFNCFKQASVPTSIMFNQQQIDQLTELFMMLMF